MKKKIICGIGVLIIIVALISIIAVKGTNVTGDNIEDASWNEDSINKNINIAEVLETVRKDALKKLEVLNDEEANKLIDLKSYATLPKKVARYEGTDEFSEIWLFRLSKESQAIGIFRLFDKRIEDLRSKYEENESITAMLSNEKNISMKQQQGIAIIIISNDVENVEKAVDKLFVKD